jgi:hypothetical protein
MVLDELHAFQEVADDSGVIWNGDSQGIFNCSHGADRMYRRSDTADTLGECPGIARIPPFHHQFHAAKTGPRAPSISHLAALHLHLYAQMTLDARDGIDYQSL